MARVKASKLYDDECPECRYSIRDESGREVQPYFCIRTYDKWIFAWIEAKYQERLEAARLEWEARQRQEYPNWNEVDGDDDPFAD
jgi:hypothetical protein